MTKRETIDRIVARNPSARPEFLAEFTPRQLCDYLQQLESLDLSAPRTVPPERVEQARV
ncbi:MAG TPA: hypothetical protein VM243_11270 [Phycisphaerae bacterium]|nr:hypothetical protein [Phycisphaerae bacterium]